jgi:uncharacterized protein
MTKADKTHHTIDYIEWPATDLIQTKAFYGKAFGWAFTDYGQDYSCPTHAGIDAGIYTDKTIPLKAPLIILYSLNLAQSQEVILDAGGKITKPVFEFPGGRRFHFTDPSGQELAVWSDK